MKKILFSIIFVALLLFSILLTLSVLSKIYFLKKKISYYKTINRLNFMKNTTKFYIIYAGLILAI